MLLFQAPAAFSDITALTVTVLILLLLSGITAGAETALFSLKAKDFNYLKTRDQFAARQAVQLLGQPKKLMATLLVANTFFNIATTITTSLLVRRLLEINGLADTGLPAFLLQVAAVLLLLALFGDVLPKVYAAQYNTRMVLFTAPVLKVLNSIFSPISGTLVSSNAYIEEQLSPRPTANMTEAELENAITQSLGHPATQSEFSIFKGILRFGKVTVRQIMRTRLDVKAIPTTLSFEELKQFLRQTAHSRIPVYQNTLDQVVGIVYSKDLMPYLNEDSYDWHTAIRPAYFVPEDKHIEDLMKELQERRIHIAVVADEFGGTSGIVTLKDILEEIIGDIRDEFDQEELPFRKIDERTYEFEGKTLINDVCRLAGIPHNAFDRVRGGSDSIGGLILELHGRFPGVNEMVQWQGYEFAVTALDGMRIAWVQVRKPAS